MKRKTFALLVLFAFILFESFGQSIADFTSVAPAAPTDGFVFPTSHRFQKIIEVGDALTEGGTMPISPDFTGYVPIAGSSINGYLSINSETAPGGNTVLDINFNAVSNLWETTASEALDFTLVNGTVANCSGTVTPWNTIISCEEVTTALDLNGDGWSDAGWNLEIDPATKMVLGKLYAMGNMAHENVTIHSNLRTVYQGSDSNPGYLYKYVADVAQNLNAGTLYVYSGLKNGAGNWVVVPNTTQNDQNTTLGQSASLGGTVFNGVEDVEIGPDGMVYLAVKSESRVYRFQDSDPITGTTATMETFAGGTSYTITHDMGTTSVPWGSGNDNMAFDGNGNLWVLQDGSTDYIWVIDNGHTPASPQVRLFGIPPIDSEPTGITFTPDYKYLFLSIQHPLATNNANQTDAAGNIIDFDLGTSLVIALADDLGETLSINGYNITEFSLFPNPLRVGRSITLKGRPISTVKLYSLTGDLVLEEKYNAVDRITLDLHGISSGTYIFHINNSQAVKLIVD